MRIVPLVKGIVSYVPGLFDIYVKVKGTGIEVSAKHYYSIWLYHLLIASEHNLPTHYETVAEFGPGDSLGTGLMALLTGSSRYFALDIIKFNDPKRNIQMLDDLAALLKKQEKISGILKTYEFPGHILTGELLGKTLAPKRVEAIRNLLANPMSSCEGIQIQYYTPWSDPDVIRKESVDMIISNAVMEHIDDLDSTYRIMCEWLRPGGVMSHQIDFRCHQTGKIWNEHWSYSDFLWKLIRGKRKFLLNREAHSTHLKLMRKHGFRIICDITSKDIQGIPRSKLAARFKDLSDDDLAIWGALIQAVRK